MIGDGKRIPHGHSFRISRTLNLTREEGEINYKSDSVFSLSLLPVRITLLLSMVVTEKTNEQDTQSTHDSITAASDEENNRKLNDEKSIHSRNASTTTTTTSSNKIEEPYTIFPTSRLIQFLIITSLTGMLSPLTGSIYFPSVNQIEAVSIY